MKKIINKIINIFSQREIILSILTFTIGIIYICNLFNIQILNGKTYRERSEKRLVRNINVTASRGEIYDRNGVVLATNKLSFDCVIYNIKVTAKEQNDGILKFINILELNKDKIYSSFPINDQSDNFNFLNKEEELKWKKEMNIKVDLDFNQTIDYYIGKYKLIEYNKIDSIKIIKIKYEASLMGYSLFKCAVIAKDISKESLAKIEEEKYLLFGIDTQSVPRRYYPETTLAAHTIGYVSRINSDDYTRLKSLGYSQNSVIGKMGVEQSFEKYLKGVDGVTRNYVDTLGVDSSETVITKPITGNSVTLTLDYRLQKVAEDALVKTINDIKNGTASMKKHEDASSGSVVVLDVNSGEVLASVSYPSFDINSFVSGIDYKTWNDLTNSSLRPLFNRSISGTYSPGSTYKMLIGLARSYG